MTPELTERVVEIIRPIFLGFLDSYKFQKYPAEPYADFKTSFEGLEPSPEIIRDAMMWKWGHWGKPNYPQLHKNLISEIGQSWSQFKSSESASTPEATFLWWRRRFNRNTTYISSAYITHLVHHASPLPIIDQHNFRGMNHLAKTANRDLSIQLTPCDERRLSKKKPSNWADIVALKELMESVLVLMPAISFGELDRFLMMYGKDQK